MNNKITSEEISICICGPTDKKTADTINRCKILLPKSEIILSTWEGNNTENIACDYVVFNKDPGAENQILKLENGAINSRPNNINRMIYSRQKGLEKVTTKYTLLLRSDLRLKNLCFLKYFNKFPLRNKEYSIFSKRIIVNSIYSLKVQSNSNGIIPLPFHVSDFWYFGLTEDIKKIYDIGLVKEPDYTQYFIKTPKPFDDSSIYPENRTWKMSPEQYLLSTLSKESHKDLTFEHYLDYNHDNISLSHNILMDNFIFLDYNKSGIYSTKFKNIEYNLKNIEFNTMYRYSNFAKEYCRKFNKFFYHIDMLLIKKIIYKAQKKIYSKLLKKYNTEK